MFDPEGKVARRGHEGKAVGCVCPSLFGECGAQADEGPCAALHDCTTAGQRWRGGGAKNSLLEKIFVGDWSPGPCMRKKNSHYFCSMCNFFLQGVGGQNFVRQISECGRTTDDTTDLDLFSYIFGYCALSCGIEERLIARGALL